MTTKTAIIGGGITGLSAAYYLQKAIMANDLDMEFKLFESSSRLGGKIQTEYRNGFVMERGPDSFLARKESASRLAKEVGIDKELVSNFAGQAYILKKLTYIRFLRDRLWVCRRSGCRFGKRLFSALKEKCGL